MEKVKFKDLSLPLKILVLLGGLAGIYVIYGIIIAIIFGMLGGIN